MFTLTALHLRCVCEATTPVRLGGDAVRAGSNLRAALGNVMTRAHCVGDRFGPAHAATCPVCWLLAANEHPGQERRGYALLPPLNAPEVVAPGERFAFGLTLFGDAARYLPYFILAVPEAGRMGVGPGRGQFALRQVWAADPLTGEAEPVLAEGDNWVHSPTLQVTMDSITRAADDLAQALTEKHGATWRLALHFLTPLRLIESDELLKTPDFGVFFARLLHRLDHLNTQFADGSQRGPEAAQELQTLANRVRLTQAETRWVEAWSSSRHKAHQTPMGGLVGRASYVAPAEVWRPLLPWVLWGQAAQVGKSVVKGDGSYEVIAPGLRRYGNWMSDTRLAASDVDTRRASLAASKV